MEYLPTYILGICLIYILYMWREDRRQVSEERRDLYDRIMSPTLTDYKVNTEPEEEEEEEVDEEEIVPVEEAKEEIMNG